LVGSIFFFFSSSSSSSSSCSSSSSWRDSLHLSQASSVIRLHISLYRANLFRLLIFISSEEFMILPASVMVFPQVIFHGVFHLVLFVGILELIILAI
jgi:hypothetical protein